jgi:phage anti-repressor protein
MNQNIKLDTVDFNSLVKSETNVILNSNCTSKMIEILNKEFTESENRWYIANLYVYMNYHPTNDFPITLDTLINLVGFANKQNAKRTLVNNFKENIDYKVLRIPKDEQVKNNREKTLLIPKDEQKNIEETRGGHNKEKIMLNIDTFKNMCMLVKTEKSKEIRSYYVKLENIYNKIIKEELGDQKRIMEEKLLEHKEQSELEKQELLEKTILEQFPRNTQCIYYGTIDDISLTHEKLIKYGNSNDLPARIKCHKKTYTNFKLVKAYKVNNQIHIENCIKQHDKLKNRRRNITINDKLYTECLALNDKFTIDKIDEHIKEIINEFEYNVENYNKLILKNEELNNVIYNLRDENEKLKNENGKLQKKVDDFQPELDIKKKNINDSLSGCLLFAFECTVNNLKKYKCEMIKEKGLDEKIEMYKKIYPDGKLVFTKNIKTINVYKIIQFMLKKHLIYVGECTLSLIHI